MNTPELTEDALFAAVLEANAHQLDELLDEDLIIIDVMSVAAAGPRGVHRRGSHHRQPIGQSGGSPRCESPSEPSKIGHPIHSSITSS
jgi:hypothetical protein